MAMNSKTHDQKKESEADDDKRGNHGGSVEQAHCRPKGEVEDELERREEDGEWRPSRRLGDAYLGHSATPSGDSAMRHHSNT